MEGALGIDFEQVTASTVSAQAAAAPSWGGEGTSHRHTHTHTDASLSRISKKFLFLNLARTCPLHRNHFQTSFCPESKSLSVAGFEAKLPSPGRTMLEKEDYSCQ